MQGDSRVGYRRRRRGSPACDGAVPHRARRWDCGEGSGSNYGGRTATRLLVALGAYVAHDVRDADGLTRLLLRRAAVRATLSPRQPARRLGGAYLRLDRPVRPEVVGQAGVVEVTGTVAPPRALPSGRGAAESIPEESTGRQVVVPAPPG